MNELCEADLVVAWLGCVFGFGFGFGLGLGLGSGSGSGLELIWLSPLVSAAWNAASSAASLGGARRSLESILSKARARTCE